MGQQGRKALLEEIERAKRESTWGSTCRGGVLECSFEEGMHVTKERQ